jgi:hypothetical protein
MTLRSWAIRIALVALVAVVPGATLRPTEKERLASAVSVFLRFHGRMTPNEVRASFGNPDEVVRDNRRALCWAYRSPYHIEMCWGAKREAAWIGHNVPLRETVIADIANPS